MSAKQAYSLKATYCDWEAVEKDPSSLPIERVQAARRKNTLAELKAKFERKHQKAPRQALLAEIRARFEQDICPPHQVFEDWVMVHHRWDCGAPNGAPMARHFMQ